jgi:transcriptional regulator with XRE-family HTH domain
LSLRKLSELTGVSASAIQKIEANSVDPCLSNLVKIARGLEQDIKVFFDEEKEERFRVIRRSEMKQASIRRFKSTMVDIHQSPRGPMLEIAEVTVKPGGAIDRPYVNLGEIIVYGLEGTGYFVVDGKSLTLGPGDALRLNQVSPEVWANDGKKAFRALVFNMERTG